MNNRILLVAAVAGLAIIIGIVGFSGQLIINDVLRRGHYPNVRTWIYMYLPSLVMVTLDCPTLYLLIT